MAERDYLAERIEILKDMLAAIELVDDDTYQDRFDKLKQLEIEAGDHDGPDCDPLREIGPIRSLAVTVQLNDLYCTLSAEYEKSQTMQVGKLWTIAGNLAHNALEPIVEQVEADPLILAEDPADGAQDSQGGPDHGTLD